MSRTLLAAAAAALIAAVAGAQYKTAPKPPATAAPPAVQMTNTAVQMTPVTAAESLDSARRIPRAEAIKMVKEKKAVYVDVRSRTDYDLGHIPGAINIPEGELMSRVRDLPVKKFLITYCA
jgi:3-mercaptopyruvate sulfurtransferase SseA